MIYFPEKHTGENIKNSIIQEAIFFGIPIDKIKIITDSGSNMLCAVKEMNSFVCFCHKLSTCIETGWNSALENEQDFFDLNSSTNKIISFFKPQARYPEKVDQKSERFQSNPRLERTM